MIPVYQDIFGEEGNCMSACLASILEIPLKEVPCFVDNGAGKNGDWFRNMFSWLHERGWDFFPYYIGVIPLDWNNLPEHLQDVHCYHLASGPGPRGWGHATVGWKGTIVHDPHPSKAGLTQVTEYYFLRRLKNDP
jgi:hypothetical protein